MEYTNNPSLLAHELKHSIASRDIEQTKKLAAQTLLFSNLPDVWYGLNIGNINPQYRLAVLMLMNASPGGMLTQPKFNFLTGRDIGARFGIDSLGKHRDLFDDNIPTHKKEFVRGMVSNLLAEAAPYRQRVITGEFELLAGGLHWLQEMVRVDTIRLSISPAGMYASLVRKTGDRILASPLWWSPEFNTLHVAGGELALALNVVLAAIWRDACVVKEQWSTERSRKMYTPRRREPKHIKSVRVLPRIVRHVRWSTPDERTGIARSAHMVRAFYRRLPSGQAASDAAIANARALGMPPPAAGYTFVKPHQRGIGGASALPPQQIVCRGLQVANMTIEYLKK